MLSAAEVLRRIGDLTALDNVSRLWDESMAQYPAKQPLFFLKEDFWQPLMAPMGLGPEWTAPLRRTAAAVAASPALSQLAWHGYWRLFQPTTYIAISGWPEPAELGEQNKGLFYVLLAMAMWPLAQKYWDALGIPEKVRQDTGHGFVGACLRIYQEGHDGRPGINQNQLWWSNLYTRTSLFRLERMQYILEPLHKAVRVYRHRHTRQVVAFPEPGLTFTADGYRFANPDDYAGRPTWTSILEQDGRTIRGNPFSPRGFASSNVLELPAPDWELVLQDGDECLSMHIPRGGGMTPEKCLESFRRGRAFYAEYFPARPAKAIVCSSWIFGNQLQDILPATANLVQLQREVFLFPSASSQHDGLWFIFLHNGPFDLASVPRQTSLQRSVAEYLDQGHRWRAGHMFLLLEDLDRFGQQTYWRGEHDATRHLKP
ncbi:MAG: acyltransferase domain-containing protein [Lentisphaeria bacterium]|nr:acyltransferase domain-containing protein [Lentisphaeria bacterium]